MQKNIDFKVLSPTRKDLDLTNEKKVEEYFSEHRPNVVLHLAGKVGGIGINKAKPAEFFYDNLMMGTLVMHHAYLNGNYASAFSFWDRIFKTVIKGDRKFHKL